MANQSFTEFLDRLLSEDQYSGVVEKLRTPVLDSFYVGMNWHSIEELLESFPDTLALLHGFAFQIWDSSMGGFSPCNLKACYVPDEDFVNGGRAFVLFNLVASSWTYIGQVNNQLNFWTKTNNEP